MTEKDKGFSVKDRRIFSQDEEEAAESKEGISEPDSAPAADRGKASESRKVEDRESGEESPPFPKINFPTFIASLNASALVHLGVIEDPASEAKQKNLPMAKQTIDILSMLEEKTVGNLTGDEANLLKNILYELRIMYVKEKK